MTEEEIRTMQDLDNFELLENFKELVTNLLKFKSKTLCTDSEGVIQ